jgi:F0F1-type ATP synthase delta subunit
MTSSEELKKLAEKIAEDNRALLREHKKFFKESLMEVKAAIKKNAGVANYIHGSLLKYEKSLKAVSKTNENVEETLGNVLLAIRQNEYLQAWHPEQYGYPAMKVTGKHPAKVKVSA